MSATDFITAIQSGNITEVRNQLSGDHRLASAKDESGVSAIMHAFYRRQHEVAALLLEAKPDLDIFEATAAGKLDRVSAILLSDRAAANSRSADGFTALHFAAFFNRSEIAQALIANGAEVSAVADNTMKVSPLHSAATSRSHEVVRQLLAARAPVNARQHGGWTALHAAAANGDAEMVRDLLAHGADPKAANDEGNTAASLAEAKGHADILRLLRAGDQNANVRGLISGRPKAHAERGR